MPMIEPVPLMLADGNERQLIFSAYAAKRLKKKLGDRSLIRNLKEILDELNEDTLVELVYECLVVRGSRGFYVPLSTLEAPTKPDQERHPEFLTVDEFAQLLTDFKSAVEAFGRCVLRANGIDPDSIPTVAVAPQEPTATSEPTVQ